ncbi:MAG: LLM class F420-dependent oxidoreductase, partial [Kribbellaceae bacterium]|nr:LLM class F420-dependent oxidoreductase [Kribbellaceae bacterium]
QYGDAANIGGGNPEVIREKCDILREHCRMIGRDYDEIIKSTGLNVFPIDKGDDPTKATEKALGPMDREKFDRDNFIGTEDEIADKVDAALEAGAASVIFYVPGVAYDLDLLERVENVAKRFA